MLRIVAIVHGAHRDPRCPPGEVVPSQARGATRRVAQGTGSAVTHDRVFRLGGGGGPPAGRTHEELEVILGLRVHDSLRSLVEAHALGREQVESVYVYLDPDPERAAAQLQERRGPLPGPTSEPTQRAGPAVEPQRVIEVLVAVIHAPKDDARAIAAHLRAGGLAGSNQQGDAGFAQYALG